MIRKGTPQHRNGRYEDHLKPDDFIRATILTAILVMFGLAAYTLAQPGNLHPQSAKYRIQPKENGIQRTAQQDQRTAKSIASQGRLLLAPQTGRSFVLPH